MKVAIIGGVAGGAGTATRLRRMDENAEIIIFERGENLSFANCGLPYYIGGTIEERKDLFVVSNDLFRNRFKIDVRNKQEVIQIDIEKKLLKVKDVDTNNIYCETYDKLVLSPGSSPLRPKIKGIDNDRIFTLRNVPDADKIKDYTEKKHVKNAVVVGGGFIGLEMTENLCNLGIKVTLVEMENQVMAPLDYSMAAIVHQHLKEQQVDLLLTRGVAGFEEKGEKVQIEFRDGKTMLTDMVIWSVGVRPEIQLVKEAGIEIGDLGGIKVDNYMQTSDPNTYALGDAIEIIHPITKKHALIPLAGPANKQARIVADNIVFGNKETYKGTYGITIAKVFGLTVASAGACAKMLVKAGIKYQSSYVHSSSHANYYPGAKPLTIKITYSPETGELYGGQIVGVDGVDKRIEMIAGIIQKNGTIKDLCELEHAYAPPYSSAKDPVNMAGFVAENILTGKMNMIHWRHINNEDFKLDVRTPKEFSEGHIPGAVNIPLEILRDNINKLPKDRNIVIYCAIGLRGYIAYRILVQFGFERIANLSGGYKTYLVSSIPI